MSAAVTNTEDGCARTFRLARLRTVAVTSSLASDPSLAVALAGASITPTDAAPSRADRATRITVRRRLFMIFFLIHKAIAHGLRIELPCSTAVRDMPIPTRQ